MFGYFLRVASIARKHQTAPFIINPITKSWLDDTMINLNCLNGQAILGINHALFNFTNINTNALCRQIGMLLAQRDVGNISLLYFLHMCFTTGRTPQPYRVGALKNPTGKH